MSKDKTYNGWDNYQTWNCALWLDNDFDTKDYWSDRTIALYGECVKDYSEPDDVVKGVTYKLSLELKRFVEDNMPTESSGMYADLLGNAISQINFYEIAEHYTNDL